MSAQRESEKDRERERERERKEEKKKKKESLPGHAETNGSDSTPKRTVKENDREQS